MGKGKRKAFIWLLFLLVASWPVVQLWDAAHAHRSSEDARKLLYQVSYFQVELMNNLLNEAANQPMTGQLDALRQAVYSADFAHQRLVLAYGEDHLTALTSAQELMQYLTRLQIGGNRPLREEERTTLQDAGSVFRQIYEAYGELLSSGGEIVGSRNRAIKQLDHDLYDMLHKRLLQ